MTPEACWLKMKPVAVLEKVAGPPMKAPRPPGPVAVIIPELVIGPSAVPSEVMPWALRPETLIVPLLISALFVPLPRSPCAAPPLVVIAPVLAKTLLLPCASMPLEEIPDVIIVPLLVTWFPVAAPKTNMPLELFPVVVIVPVAAFNTVLLLPPSVNMPSD